MPESPVAPEQVEAQFVPAVPIREGEKRFEAGLNLEDARRRESVIADLQDQLKKLAGTSQGEVRSQFARSPTARRRQQLIINKTRELKNATIREGDSWIGPCAPATVINLNPVALELSGPLQELKVPAAEKGAQIKLSFRGRLFIGSYVTIATPKVWLRTTGTTNDPTGDTATFEAQHIPPLGLAHQFYSHFTEGASDAQHMGGILVFEGEIHALDKVHLERSKRILKTPTASWSPEGSGEIIYSTEPIALDVYLARELDRQRAHAEEVIAQGHTFANSNSDIVRNQLSNNHKIWHNFALERGYITVPYPWASSKLKDGPLEHAVFCPDCRTRQEDPQQFFCRNCNAPFDAYKAFMAGKQVTPDRLAAYDETSKEWKGIMDEMERRRANLARLSGEPKRKAKADD